MGKIYYGIDQSATYMKIITWTCDSYNTLCLI